MSPSLAKALHRRPEPSNSGCRPPAPGPHLARVPAHLHRPGLAAAAHCKQPSPGGRRLRVGEGWGGEGVRCWKLQAVASRWRGLRPGRSPAHRLQVRRERWQRRWRGAGSPVGGSVDRLRSMVGRGVRCAGVCARGGLPTLPSAGAQPETRARRRGRWQWEGSVHGWRWCRFWAKGEKSLGRLIKERKLCLGKN